MGHVADAFSEKTLEKLPGHIAIGHVRYSTAGDSKLDNAQPILIDCTHGQIAIGHNGNLVNASELKDELVKRGSIFQTSTDTEVILHLYARSRAATSDEAIVEAISHGAGRVFARADDQGPPDRRAGSARVPAARHRPSRRRRHRLLRNVRARSDRSHLRSRRRTGRSRDRERVGRQIVQAVCACAVCALHLRARLLRAARQLCLRGERQRGEDRTGAPARARAACRRRRHCAGARLRCMRGHRVCGTGRDSDARRADPQPLRGPHVHRASAVHSAFRGAGEAEPRAQHPRRQARRPGRRFPCSWDHQPEDREDGEGGRSQGSAYENQLPADDLSVLLRCGHAAPIRADRGNPHARGNSEVHRRRQPGLSQPRGSVVVCRDSAHLLLHVVLHGTVSRWRSRETKRRIFNWRSSWIRMLSRPSAASIGASIALLAAAAIVAPLRRSGVRKRCPATPSGRPSMRLAIWTFRCA